MVVAAAATVAAAAVVATAVDVAMAAETSGAAAKQPRGFNAQIDLWPGVIADGASRPWG
jgi:hypothetical protein